MKKKDVVAVFGNKAAVARFLNVNRSAITQWPNTVPELRQYQLRARRPTIDKEIAALRKAAA